MKKKNICLIVVVVFGSLFLILGGFIIYDKLLFNNFANENEPTKTESHYNIDDYVSIINDNIIVLDKNRGTVKKIEFKNLDTLLTTDFINRHNALISPEVYPVPENELVSISNNIIYDTSRNILSVYELDTYDGFSGFQEVNYVAYDFYSININLDERKLMTNQELLELYKINSTSVFEKILNNIANDYDYLLIPTESQAVDTMAIKDFKNKIKKYAKQINNRFDKLVLYVEDDKVFVVFDEEEILQLIGLKSRNRYESWGSSDLEPRVLQLN